MDTSGETIISEPPHDDRPPSPDATFDDRLRDIDGTRGLSESAARTKKQLLVAASSLIQTLGHVPSIREVAEAAGVSRATAYRYFPSRSKLIAAVVDHSLGPVRSFVSSHRDAEHRVDELFRTTFLRFREFEPQMRAALQLSMEHAALAAAGRLDEEAYRRGFRIAILERTLEPLKDRLPADEFDRLCKAMSLLFGIEPYVVLKDIWGSTNEEVGEIALWMAEAILARAASVARQAQPAEQIARGDRRGGL